MVWLIQMRQVFGCPGSRTATRDSNLRYLHTPECFVSAVAALPQRGNGIQPRVGAQRLPWVNNLK